MNLSYKLSMAHNFSHIYIEYDAKKYPLTKQILDKFKLAKVINVEHYKDIFNAPNQDFREQKKRMALILAVKKEPYLYKGSFYSDGFGFEQFYYTSLMKNCLYDCSYCYLQGVYPSGHKVVYVNIDTIINSTIPLLDKPTLIAISYDTDTLAVESITGHTNRWIDFAKNQPNLHLEIRTKSANFNSISKQKPNPNITLAWTLSPQKIIDLHEPKTPSLNLRLKAIKEAINKGWKVRLSIDPMIFDSEFEKIYIDLIDKIFSMFLPEEIYQLTLGTFRMATNHLKKIKKMAHTPLAFYPYTQSNNMVTYPKDLEQTMIQTIYKKVLLYLPKEKIRLWQT